MLSVKGHMHAQVISSGTYARTGYQLMDICTHRLSVNGHMHAQVIS
jgi:hypothetical protein